MVQTAKEEPQSVSGGADAGIRRASRIVTAEKPPSSGFAPPDIFEHSFEDGTSGGLVNGIFDPILEPGNSDWVLDTTTAATGSNSVKWVLNFPSGNQGSGGINHVQLCCPPETDPPGLITAGYFRWAMKLSDPFNAGHSGIFKIFRQRDRLFGAGAGTMQILRVAGHYAWGWDSINPILPLSANMNLPAPDAHDHIGEWHWFEIFEDITTSGDLQVKIWIDGVQYFEWGDTSSNLGRNLRTNQFAPLINEANGPGTVWIDDIAVSTQRIGP